MASDDSREVPTAGLSYFDALKVVALPFASVFSVACVILFFAADAWVRGIVAEEMSGGATTTNEHGDLLASHAGTLRQHDEEIEDNERDIERHDQRFTEFVAEILRRP